MSEEFFTSRDTGFALAYRTAPGGQVTVDMTSSVDPYGRVPHHLLEAMVTIANEKAAAEGLMEWQEVVVGYVEKAAVDTLWMEFVTLDTAVRQVG